MENLAGAINMKTLLGLVVFLFLLFVFVIIYFSMRFSNLKKRYDQMMADKEGQSFETMVLTRLDDIKEAKKDIATLNNRCNGLSEQLIKCVQRVGIVRFNAFEDTGSDLSFSIAMLDEKNDGVVISSIYGRTEARCYGKPIVNGKSTYMLSDEEKQAIENSKK